MSVYRFFHFLLFQDKMECDQQIVLKTIEAESEDRVQEGNLLARRIPAYMKKILICTKVVEERVAVLIQGYNDRVLERGQIRKSPGVD